MGGRSGRSGRQTMSGGVSRALCILGNAWAVAMAHWYLRRADRIGSRVRLWGRPRVHNSGTMLIGDRVRLASTTATIELAAIDGGILDVGEGTFINYGCSIAAHRNIRVGARCNIGTHAIIMDSDFHNVELDRRNEQADALPIVIGDDVWLGSRVIILKGVTIGAGSVIGAASVVTRDIPAMSVAVGQPARVIRSL